MKLGSRTWEDHGREEPRLGWERWCGRVSLRLTVTLAAEKEGGLDNLTACIVITQERNEVTSILHLACVHWSTWLLQLLGAELAVKQGLVDRISELEDGILGRIVSRLPLKQAVATSVLSKRWRYVWSHTRNLELSRGL
ncbi:unnamed protein product [Prunus brigantina]